MICEPSSKYHRLYPYPQRFIPGNFYCAKIRFKINEPHHQMEGAFMPDGTRSMNDLNMIQLKTGHFTMLIVLVVQQQSVKRKPSPTIRLFL